MAFDQKEYVKNWYQENKETVKARARASYAANREAVKARSRAFHAANPERIALYRKRRRFSVLYEIFTLLGNTCALCRNADKYVLQIDHVNGGGRKHSQSTHRSMTRFYGVILLSAREAKGEYQLLCANCNVRECIRKGYRNSIWDFAESFFKDL